MFCTEERQKERDRRRETERERGRKIRDELAEVEEKTEDNGGKA